MSYWVSTDLDGTLLDHSTYSFEGAKEGIALCQKNNISIILNTSKTLEETLHIQKQLGINGPVIVENGSALVFPPEPNLSQKIKSLAEGKALTTLPDGSTQIMFGVERFHVLEFIRATRDKHNWKVDGFNDWSITQICQQTGLNEEQAESAASKSFSEPFTWQDNDDNFLAFKELAEGNDFKLLKGGRFYHLQGNCSKATPLLWIKRNLSLLPNFEQIEINNYGLICLGDNHNDIDMLNISDIPVCIKTNSSDYPDIRSTNKAIYTSKVGPHGWTEAITKILTPTQ